MGNGFRLIQNGFHKRGLKESVRSRKYSGTSPVIYIFFAVIFFFIWKLNILTPLWADDLCKGVSEGLSGVINDTWYEYMHVGGRLVPVFFARLLLGRDFSLIEVFNFANAVIFVIFLILIFVVVYTRKPKYLTDMVPLLLIFYLVFIGIRASGEIILWKNGSIFYLWGMVLNLIYLMPFFRRKFFDGLSGMNQGTIYLLMLNSFLSSFFMEHFAVAVTLFSLYMVIRSLTRSPNNGNWIYLAFFSFFHGLGTLVLLVAPGNYERTATEDLVPLFSRAVTNLNLANILVPELYVPFIIFALTFLFRKRLSARLTNNTFLGGTLFMFVVCAVFFSFLPSGQPLQYRIAFPLEMMVILATIYLFRFTPKNLLFNLSLFMYLTAVLIAHSGVAYKDAVSIDTQVKKRFEYIENMKKSGVRDLVVNKIDIPGKEVPGQWYLYKYNYISDFGDKPDGFMNSCFTGFYDLYSIYTVNPRAINGADTY